jgi:hypothetical protein
METKRTALSSFIAEVIKDLSDNGQRSLSEAGNYSAPMRLKNDPDKNVKAVLKKYKLQNIENDVIGWIGMEMRSPASLKKLYVLNFATNAFDDKGYQTKEDWQVDLADKSTWPGDVPDIPVDQFFIDLSNAIKTDEKRVNKRSSYEF